MWIFCCGMKRSGSTLQFQITAELVETAGLGRRVEWVKPQEFQTLREKYAPDSGLKVFKTHICTDEMVEEFEKGNAKGIYVYRDMRDVFVSMMRKSSTTIENLLSAGFYEECYDNYIKWNSLDGVLVSKYEGMVCDLNHEVRRIANHLGIELDGKTYDKIAENYSKEKQINRMELSKKSRSLKQVDQWKFDPNTLLHTDHIRSGEIKEWKKHLTKKQIVLLENRAKKWLEENGYELSAGKPNLIKRLLNIKLR